MALYACHFLQHISTTSRWAVFAGATWQNHAGHAYPSTSLERDAKKQATMKNASAMGHDPIFYTYVPYPTAIAIPYREHDPPPDGQRCDVEPSHRAMIYLPIMFRNNLESPHRRCADVMPSIIPTTIKNIRASNEKSRPMPANPPSLLPLLITAAPPSSLRKLLL